MEKLEWSFHYQGPKCPMKTRGCMTCASAVGRMCMATPTPHKELDPGCGLCMAAQDGLCGAHARGIEAALDECMSGMSKPQAAHFSTVRALIEEELAHVPEEGVVSIRAYASIGQHVGIDGDRSGAPRRTVVVEVNQIDE